MTSSWPAATRYRIHQGSVGNPDDCSRVVNEVLEQFGRVDYLVNNAGVTVDKKYER